MTTAETVRVLEHVSATVKAREDKGEDGWRIQVDIPSFKTKYPTVLNFVAADMAAKLVPNTAVNLVLVRDKLRTDSNGKAYDGKWKWHYWWRLDSFWDGKQEAPVPGSPSVAEQAQAAATTPAPRQSWDDRTVDIEAAWAIGQASEISRFLARNTPPGEYDGADVLSWADWFLSIKRQLVAEMRGISAPQPSPQATVHGEPVEAPDFADLGQFYTWAQTMGYPTVRSRMNVPGVAEAIEAKDYPKAAQLLEAARRGK